MSDIPLREEMKAFRAKHKLCQAGLGKGTGYARKFIQKIEHGRGEPSAEGAARIREFMATATEDIIAPLRGPGAGNSPSKKRRGRKLRPYDLDRVEVAQLAPEEVDEELEHLCKKY